MVIGIQKALSVPITILDLGSRKRTGGHTLRHNS